MGVACRSAQATLLTMLKLVCTSAESVEAGSMAVVRGCRSQGRWGATTSWPRRVTRAARHTPGSGVLGRRAQLRLSHIPAACSELQASQMPDGVERAPTLCRAAANMLPICAQQSTVPVCASGQLAQSQSAGGLCCRAHGAQRLGYHAQLVQNTFKHHQSQCMVPHRTQTSAHRQ